MTTGILNQVLPLLIVVLSLIFYSECFGSHSLGNFYSKEKYQVLDKIPVIIDTDVGSFLDDTIAIVFAALSEYLDVKLIVTCSNDVDARAKVTAKLLQLVGRDDIPIGMGIKNDNQTVQTLFPWAEDVNITTYKGMVYEDGIGKMAEIIASSPTPVNIIAIGPMINFPTLIQRYPDSVKNARIMAMAGSIYRGYSNSSIPSDEYNVRFCPYCFDVMLKAGWEITMTPLDTCGTVRLNVRELQQLFKVDGQQQVLGLASSLVYNCLYHAEPCNLADDGTPILFDAVATLLTLPIAGEYLEFKDLMLSVDSRGYTVVNEASGSPVKAALNWKDEDKFTAYLVRVLSGMPVKQAKTILNKRENDV